jgi:hypothetical protein
MLSTVAGLGIDDESIMSRLRLYILENMFFTIMNLKRSSS